MKVNIIILVAIEAYSKGEKLKISEITLTSSGYKTTQLVRLFCEIAK